MELVTGAAAPLLALAAVLAAAIALNAAAAVIVAFGGPARPKR